ncbi:hypothetical protein HMPREF9073_00676, partial [Capnocytophaga sp. oral taxon 326 str. F0382]
KFCSFAIDNNDAFALIPARHQTVATIFKKAGYATAAIGKWHLGLGDRGGIDWNKPILMILALTRALLCQRPLTACLMR